MEARGEFPVDRASDGIGVTHRLMSSSKMAIWVKDQPGRDQAARGGVRRIGSLVISERESGRVI